MNVECSLAEFVRRVFVLFVRLAQLCCCCYCCGGLNGIVVVIAGASAAAVLVDRFDRVAPFAISCSAVVGERFAPRFFSCFVVSSTCNLLPAPYNQIQYKVLRTYHPSPERCTLTYTYPPSLTLPQLYTQIHAHTERCIYIIPSSSPWAALPTPQLFDRERNVAKQYIVNAARTLVDPSP